MQTAGHLPGLQVGLISLIKVWFGGLEFRVWGFKFRVWGFKFTVWGIRIWGLRFRAV